MKTRIARNSGAGGQISPLLTGRDDLVKQQTGDQRVRNYIVLPEGPRTRRPGTRYMGALRNEARPVRFIEFDAGPGDTYMLVLNDGFIRFYKDALLLSGSVPYEIAHPWTDDELTTLFPAQSIDVIFIAARSKPRRLTRYSDTHWELDDYPYVQGPVRTQNTNKSIKITPSATTGTVTLTATGGNIFSAGHVGSVWKLEEQDFSEPPVWKALEAIGLNNRRRYKARIYQAVSLNAGPPGDSGPNPPTHDDGDYLSGGGNVTWRYVSESFGYVRITSVASPTSAQAEVLTTLPLSITISGTFRWYEAAWSDVRGWPSTVSISDQSLVWAMGNHVWLTSPTDIYDFSITAEDDSAVDFPIVSPDGKRTDVQWIMPAGIIIAGTASSEWVVRGSANVYDRLTNTNAKAIRQGSKGSAAHLPAFVDEGAVFISRSRRKLIFVKFDAVTEQVQFKDFTTYSREMLRGQAQQVVAQSDPHPLLYVRDKTGNLQCATFLPDEDVLGWAPQPFANGKIIEIGAKQANDESHTELWLCLERIINGTTRRYIERMEPFFEPLDADDPTAEGAWFVDCGKIYQGAATATITGAGHLEGQEIAVFCNGQEFARKTVTGGSFTIERAMTNVLYGVPIRAEILSLPFDTSIQTGTTRGSMKDTARVYLDVFQSIGGKLASYQGNFSNITQSAGLPLGTPMALASGIEAVTIEPRSMRELQLHLVHDDALPSTLRGWLPNVDVKEP